MFNDKQNQVLAYELDSNRIKSRQKGNFTLSYLEGFDIIETANKIFGYGNWDYSITKLEVVSQEVNQNQNNVICYKAIVKVVVHDMQHSKLVSREDVGYGTGIAKTLADAHEGGGKESVTDALKRCFKLFGSQYGLSLYDKSKQHKQQNYQQPEQLQQPQQQYQQKNQQPTNQQVQNNAPLDYSSLYNLGLTITEQGSNLIIVGDDIYNKRDSIKACGFKFSSSSKLWWKPVDQQVA